VGGIVWLVLIIVVISAVVGAIAQFLNKLGEMNTPAKRPVRRRAERRDDEPAAAPARPQSGDRDMDRFLAEIDRLRRKNTGEPTAAAPPPVAQVVRPQARPVDRPRPRVVAELAEQPPPSRRVDQPQPTTFVTAPEPAPTRAEHLPVAQVVAPSASTGAPATRVTRLSSRPKPAQKSDFARNMFNLLGTPQGVAMAVVLQEVLGPPKSKRG
jgi:hypothetical protein